MALKMKKFIAAVIVVLFFMPLRAQDDFASFALLRRTLHPDAALSYFDHEGNSPFNGEGKSKLLRLEEFKGDERLFTFQFIFNVKAVPGAYSGWYFSAKQGTFNFANKNVVRFELKGTKDIPTDAFQIGIRSINVNPSDNSAKVFLSELGYTTFPTEYTTIELPVSLLLEKEPNLDLSKINDVLIFAFIEPQAPIVEQSVYFRNVSWDWGLSKTKKGLSAMLSNVMFDTGKSTLKPETIALLDQFIPVLKPHAKSRWEIEGHTDTVGGRSTNMDLSKRRAQSVKDYLVKKGGFSADLIAVAGKGPDEPISTNETDAGRAQNRRVELIVKP